MHGALQQQGGRAPAHDPLLDEAARLLLRLKQAGDDPSVARAVAEWVARSDRHASAWAAAEKIWSLTGQIGANHAVFRNSAKPRHRPRRGTGHRRQVVAAALAAALAACLIVILVPVLKLRLQADYRTGTGDTRIIALKDGSTVQLDTGTSIALADSRDARGVRLLAGRAFFHVAKDPARPFSVTAGDVKVTVTGTRFDVGLTSHAIDVMLAEGTVNARYPQGQVAMAPGEHLHFDRQRKLAAMESVPVNAIAAWRRGKLLIEGAPVSAIVDQIRPYFPGLIIVTDGTLASRKVTGAFDLRDPAGALQTIVEPHAGKVRRISPWLILVSAS